MKRDPATAGGATARMSLSERIRRDIEGRIVSGAWTPGDRIPFEHELMADYGCARMTVNKAISALVAAGLVVRRRRAGSFVAELRSDRSIMEIHDFLRDAERLNLPYRHRVIEDRVERLGGTEARRLGVAPGQSVRRLTCVHSIGTERVALERRVILLETVPQAREQSFVEVPPGSWLLQRVPWSRAEHVIRAINADADTARMLELPEGEACLVLERRTWQVTALITDVRLIHPGARQSFVGSFTPMGREAG